MHAGGNAILTHDELAGLKDTIERQRLQLIELEHINQRLAAEADAIARENLRSLARLAELEAEGVTAASEVSRLRGRLTELERPSITSIPTPRLRIRSAANDECRMCGGLPCSCAGDR